MRANRNQTTKNQGSSSSTGRSSSSSSSGISPALLHSKQSKNSNKSKNMSSDVSLQKRSSLVNKENFFFRSASSSSDDFAVVSPKLNRNQPMMNILTTTETVGTANKFITCASIVRRHTITFGSEKSEAAISSALTSLMNNTIVPTTDDKTKSKRRLIKASKRWIDSKSATNLTYTIPGNKCTNLLSQACTLKLPKTTNQNDKAVKKTILNLSPLSISASSVSSSSGQSNDNHPPNSNSNSSLMSERRSLRRSFENRANSGKGLVTSLADEVGSVTQMSTSSAVKTAECEAEMRSSEPFNVSDTLTSKTSSKYESFI